MYINKLEELKKEFEEYEYDIEEIEELEEDIAILEYILMILKRKSICMEISNFDNEF